MALKIQWTKRAAKSFDKIVDYIEENGSEKSAIDFVKKTDKLLGEIAENPNLCPKIEGTDVRKGVITKQTSLYYRIMDKVIRLITFWDNPRDPDKLKI